MKHLLLLLCLVMGINAGAQQMPRSLTASTGLFIGYYEYKPVDYDVDPSKKYPLIIFLHGIGERGNGSTELSRVLANAIPRYIEAGSPMRFTTLSGSTETFLVLSPQLSSAYGSWQNIYVDEMLKYAKLNLRVDTNRIYLTGLSLGGGGTWRYASSSLANARQFAAIAAVCGTCDWSNLGNLANANLPVWAFHAQDDGIVGVGCTNNAINTINSFNPAVKPLKTIYADGYHYIWDRAYDTTLNWQNPNVFEWFLGQAKGLPVNTRPIANAGADKIITLPLSTITLSSVGSSDVDGSIARYAWRVIQTPGSGGWIDVPAGAAPTVYWLNQGVYRFELTVVDNRAGSSKDTVTVTVNPTSANLPPVAAAGTDAIILTPSISLDASSSYDLDGYVSAYSWRQVSGPQPATLNCTGCAGPTISDLVNGIYGMEVEVTDNLGAKTKDTVFITEMNATVPVNFTYFKGKNQDKNNILQWGTASEFNNAKFEIQRSSNGQSFEVIGSVAGSGTSVSPKDYKYIDASVPAGLVYYRLRQVDFDGAYKYSAVITMSNDISKILIEAFPNPVTDELKVSFTGKTNAAVSLRLLNQQGQVVREQQISDHGEQAVAYVNTRSLGSGIYFLEINSGEIREIKKIVKK